MCVCVRERGRAVEIPARTVIRTHTLYVGVGIRDIQRLSCASLGKQTKLSTGSLCLHCFPSSPGAFVVPLASESSLLDGMGNAYYCGRFDSAAVFEFSTARGVEDL